MKLLRRPPAPSAPIRITLDEHERAWLLIVLRKHLIWLWGEAKAAEVLNPPDAALGPMFIDLYTGKAAEAYLIFKAVNDAKDGVITLSQYDFETVLSAFRLPKIIALGEASSYKDALAPDEHVPGFNKAMEGYHRSEFDKLVALSKKIESFKTD